MDQEQLRQRFPRMRPLNGTPALFTINGCGVSLYGSRDHDRETGTYVATYCVTLVFIPVLAIGAYRVAKADRGWYFIGKEPISGFAKYWNIFVAAAIAALIAIPQYNDYVTSPAYLAKKQLAKAKTELATHDLKAAVKDFVAVVDSDTDSVPEAQASLKALFPQQLKSLPLADAAGALNSIVRLKKPLRERIASEADLVALGKELAGHEEDPRGALLALNAISALIKPEEKAALQESLFVKLVAKEPNDIQALNELAQIYESQNKIDRCEEILAPKRANLAGTEGARILGRIDAAKGRNEESYQLLFPYCKERLKTFKELERRCLEQQKKSYEAAFNALNEGAAGAAWYNKYKSSPKDKQEELSEAWAMDYVKKDKALAAAYDSLAKAATVVPVALDLGIVTLMRAQTITDAAARKTELESAEKTFLAIKGVAGDNDDFHLAFGQVCYWLGKHEEGDKEFDTLLTKQNRPFTLLMRIGQIMREVGATEKARAFTEEAYKIAKDDNQRHAAAGLRSLSFKDMDDSLQWLEKCDKNEKYVACQLSYTRGIKALQSGDNVRAAASLRECIAGYETMPKSPSTLNNGALASHSLFDISGDPADLKRGNAWLEEAIALEPGDSILITNLANHLLQAGIMEVVGKRIDQTALRMTGSSKLLYYCFQNESEKAKLANDLQANANFTRAVTYLEKLLVLSPKYAPTYSTLGFVHSMATNTDGLRALQQRLASAKLDPMRNQEELDDFISGKNDAKLRGMLTTRNKILEDYIKNHNSPADALSIAVAAGELTDNRIAAALFGDSIDYEETVRLAEKGNSTAPSSSTKAALASALFARAVNRVSEKDPAMAALRKQHQRVLSSDLLITVACAQPALQKLFATDPDVIRAVAVSKENNDAFPHHPDIELWALLKALNDPDADKYAQAIAKSELDAISTDLNLALGATSAKHVLAAYWQHLASGDKTGAESILSEARKRKVALPELAL